MIFVFNFFSWFDEFISWNSKLGIDVSDDLSFRNNSKTYWKSVDVFLSDHPIFRVVSSFKSLYKIKFFYVNRNQLKFKKHFCIGREYSSRTQTLDGIKI